MTWKNSTMVRREKGTCSIRGSCGKKGIFGQSLPCPDNGKADAVCSRQQELTGPINLTIITLAGRPRYQAGSERGLRSRLGDPRQSLLHGRPSRNPSIIPSTSRTIAILLSGLQEQLSIVSLHLYLFSGSIFVPRRRLNPNNGFGR
jgi:hypothetical protein